MASNLSLTVETRTIPIFFRLLQSGFEVETEVGCSVRTLLSETLGLETNYIEERIQTVFLDGEAVDDIGTAVVRDGSVLALSAAMPGLIGAVLRKGSYYAAMRREISHKKEIESTSSRKGRVVVKLFNLLNRELGQLFLERGIWVPDDDFRDILEKHSDSFVNELKLIEIDGKGCNLDQLTIVKWDSGRVFLRIRGG
ncbi:MAG: hypothetical protein JXC33_11060 [Deltaproteobacteria bacterium]|nr:hypothetical protein [Deltaproteobacteria bacterium]